MKHTIILSLTMITAVVASRLLPHPANFSPISALLLLFPLGPVALLGLFVSDIMLGFHSTLPYVYGSYLLIYIIARFVKRDTLQFFALPLFSALLFFVVTNFGVWASTSMYTKDLAGLLQSYWMGIPFFRNTLVGDIFFFGILYCVSFLRRQESRQRLISFFFQFSVHRSQL